MRVPSRGSSVLSGKERARRAPGVSPLGGTEQGLGRASERDRFKQGVMKSPQRKEREVRVRQGQRQPRMVGPAFRARAWGSEKEN